MKKNPVINKKRVVSIKSDIDDQFLPDLTLNEIQKILSKYVIVEMKPSVIGEGKDKLKIIYIEAKGVNENVIIMVQIFDDENTKDVISALKLGASVSQVMLTNPRAIWNPTMYEKILEIIETYLKDYVSKVRKFPDYKLEIAKEDFPEYTLKGKRKFNYSVPIVFTNNIDKGHAFVSREKTLNTIIYVGSVDHFIRNSDTPILNIENFDEVYPIYITLYFKLLSHELVHLLQLIKGSSLAKPGIYGRSKKGVPDISWIESSYELKPYLENMILNFIYERDEIKTFFDLEMFVDREIIKFKNEKFKKTLIKDFFRFLNITNQTFLDE